MEEVNHLFGSCACERNQYTVVIPNQDSELAQVFFDNSASNRRTQATPISAWLRVPLDWYHSTTYAQFPDETHSSIKKTFNTRASSGALPPTRRQFCGYCGTHLTAWNEGLAGGGDRSADHVDVTLGSLMNESLDRLEEMQIYGDLDEDEGEEGEGGDSEVEEAEPTDSASGSRRVVPQRRGATAVHQMRNRGMPYFESLVENSPLGRIKRQRGGQSSQDGASHVEWEIVEIGGDEDEPMPDRGDAAAANAAAAATGNGNKRLRMDI